jgi:hypothetical protein
VLKEKWQRLLRGLARWIGFDDPTWEEQMAYVREVFGFSLMEIYEVLGGWPFSGDPIPPHRLRALYESAKLFAESGLKMDYSTKHCLIGKETEFFQALKKDPLDAVLRLIQVKRRHRGQREWLDKTLIARPFSQPLDDFLPPHYRDE